MGCPGGEEKLRHSLVCDNGCPAYIMHIDCRENLILEAGAGKSL